MSRVKRKLGDLHAPEGKPFACHRNGRPWENQRENIYWGSREDNTADMIRHASLDRGAGSVQGAI